MAGRNCWCWLGLYGHIGGCDGWAWGLILVFSLLVGMLALVFSLVGLFWI